MKGMSAWERTELIWKLVKGDRSQELWTEILHQIITHAAAARADERVKERNETIDEIVTVVHDAYLPLNVFTLELRSYIMNFISSLKLPEAQPVERSDHDSSQGT